MKQKLRIPEKIGFCKNCFRLKRNGSAYCGECKNNQTRQIFYTDKQNNFPLFDKITQIFPVDDKIILTYGDTIYFDKELSYHLVVHELTHCLQQTNPEKWWDEYLKNPKFRLIQELEAYQNQYFCSKRVDFLNSGFLLEKIAEDLSSDLYGKIISFEEAKKLIISYEENKHSF